MLRANSLRSFALTLPAACLSTGAQAAITVESGARSVKCCLKCSPGSGSTYSGIVLSFMFLAT